MSGERALQFHAPQAYRPDRAVIDIGSNTVRLVVYSGSRRAPDVWLNEKVSARLGRDLSETGQIPEKASTEALAALARYSCILSDIGVEDVQVVATAAVRDAHNGREFLAAIEKTGLKPRLLSGEEEAQAAAFGVISAFPGAVGTVADLGGGSLELVKIENDNCHGGTSLPHGTLRLPKLRALGSDAFEKTMRKAMGKVGWAAAHPGPLYLVGGTWRAFAAYAMHTSKFPLTDPHGFHLDAQNADKIAKQIARMEPAELSAIQGISSSRAAGLPDAAAMLRVMTSELRPEGLIFSSWGLREGLLYQGLRGAVRKQDPFLAAMDNFTLPRGGSATLAAQMAAWTADAATQPGNASERGDSERLRLAATMLALAVARVEPNLRQSHAYQWAINKRWVNLGAAGRAQLAAAMLAFCGKPSVPDDLLRLADEASLREAAGWGLAIRLCRRLGAGSQASLMASTLRREGERLVLWIDESRAQLATNPASGDLKTLAQWLGLAPELRIGKPDPVTLDEDERARR